MDDQEGSAGQAGRPVRRRRRTWLIVALACLLGLGLLSAVVVFAVPPLLREAFDFAVKPELQSTVRSPDGAWEVRTYYLNPGAMASAWDRVDLVNLKDGTTRELWTGPPLPSDPVWLDNTTVLVGEQKLDVHGKATDADAAPVGGFPTPRQAVEAYIRAVGAADLSGVQRASRLMVTQATLPGLQRETFRTTKKLVVLSLASRDKHNLTASDQVEFDVRAKVRWPDGKTRALRLTALAIQERGAWHAEWAWPSEQTAP